MAQFSRVSRRLSFIAAVPNRVALPLPSDPLSVGPRRVPPIYPTASTFRLACRHPWHLQKASLHAMPRRNLGSQSRRCLASSAPSPPRPMENSMDPSPRLVLYNTLTRRKELFTPREDEGVKVSMYVCGVTVYDYSHIGHARVYVAFDVLYRFLRSLGYDVTYVRNFTDIDDKIIARASSSDEDPLALSRRFTTEFHKDMDALGCLRPTLEPCATDHIDDMIASIEKIISHGHGYVVEGGDVFFDVASLPAYGELSGRKPDDNRAGERVAVDQRKRSAADFALWKAAKPGEPTWDSPWGPGRPGWHIECSAMISAILGDVVDIHGGGQDLVFPHHENELAQARASMGPSCACQHHSSHSNGDSTSVSSKSQFVRYWVHNGFVNVDAEKMSKSLGNFFTIRDVLKQYHPFALRWFLINTQYRQGVNYTQRALEEASDRLFYLFQTITDLQDALGSEEGEQARRAVALWVTGDRESEPHLPPKFDITDALELLNQVRIALADDLNTPAAIAALSSPLKTVNDLLHTRKGRKTPNRLYILASFEYAFKNLLSILGLWTEDVDALLEQLRDLALVRAGISEADLLAAIEKRAVARASKDFTAADAVRMKLERMGIQIMDSPEGTTWKPGMRLDIADKKDLEPVSS